MKTVKYFMLMALGSVVATSCEKKNYNNGGLLEYEHHYYAAYIPNNNSLTTVQRNQAALLKLPVQFYSAFVRDYDAVAFYGPVTTGLANPAVLGQDYNIVNKSGNVITPINGKYSIVFPQAKRAKDTIYIKLLNSTIAGTRRVEIRLMENLTEKFRVDTFSTAFNRPIDIK